MTAADTTGVLKVFIDGRWAETGERLLPLARYLFGQKERALPTFRDQFTHNRSFDGIQLAEDVRESDFMYLPVNYSVEVVDKYFNLISELEILSQKHGKKIVVEAYSKDIVDPQALRFPFLNGVYLNSALIKSRSEDYFAALPYFIPDCLKNYFRGEINILDKAPVPSVGFCGVAAPLGATFSKTKIIDACRLLLSLLDDWGWDSEKIARACGTNMKHAHRCKAILKLRSSQLVKADIIVRSKGGLVSNNYTNLDDFDSYNLDFYENLNRNLYSLCSRGTENYSVRLYETFCMGRIPVLIDTDCKFPFESKIDYERHCVLIAKKEVRSIDARILEFHTALSKAETLRVQRQNRQLWCDYFSNRAFYYELAKDFVDRARTDE